MRYVYLCELLRTNFSAYRQTMFWNRACFEPAINGRGGGGVSGVDYCWLMICLFVAVLLFAGEDGVGGVGCVGCVAGVAGDDGVGGVGAGPALSSTQHYQFLPH